MPKAHTRCYSIEIKNAEGVRLFSTKAYWTEKERRVALGQIMRLAGMPEVSFYAGPSVGKGVVQDRYRNALRRFASAHQPPAHLGVVDRRIYAIGCMTQVERARVVAKQRPRRCSAMGSIGRCS